jgi:hypothetical protein
MPDKTNALALPDMPDPATHIVLAPQREVAGRLTPLHVVNWTTIRINPEVETYPIQGGGVGLHKSALNKVATAAGIRVLTSKPLVYEDDRLLWQVEVEMDMGGSEPARGIGSKEWKKGVGKDGNDSEHRVSKTETKALLRAIRQLLGIQTKYDAKALMQPIAVPHILYSPDLSDPDVARYAIERERGAQATLYGSAPALPDGVLNLDGEVADEDEVEDAGTPEVVEVEVEVEAMPDFALADPDDREYQRELQNVVYRSNGSPFDGQAFATIVEDARGGLQWFDRVAAWGKERGDALTPEQASLVGKASDFARLVRANGGNLL